MGWRTLLAIAFLLFTSNSYSQITLGQVLDSIVKKGNQRGVDMKTLIRENVNHIHIVKELPRSSWNTKILGKAVPLKNGKYDLYIIREMFKDFYIAERVVIHEIGHALGLRHCCYDSYCVQIMASQQATDPEHILYQIAYKTTEYEKIFNVYFDEIKKIHVTPFKRQIILRKR